MISIARHLREHASFEELVRFSLKSVLHVVTLALFGFAVLEVLPSFARSEPSLDKTYTADVIFVLGLVGFVVGVLLLASTNYRLLQDTVVRCELASDEMAWINRSGEYERMVEDRELMRLAANVSRVCRTYRSTNALLVEFLGEYRKLLESYYSGKDETLEARIQDMNEAAEEVLQQYARRKAREYMRWIKKEEEG